MGEVKGFKIIDRRGQKKERPEPTPIIDAPEEAREGDYWKSVAYLLVPVQMPFGMVTVCKAVGLRQDELMYVADYALMPYYREVDADWMEPARKRLDTFLNCNCKRGHTCGTHAHYLRQWQEADSRRLEYIGQAAMPECLEVYIKAAQAKAQRHIVAPDMGHR